MCTCVISVDDDQWLLDISLTRSILTVFRNHIKSSPEAFPRMQTHGLRGAVISDRYKVNGRIGAGSFGEIYNCTDLADSTEVRYLSINQIPVKRHLNSIADEKSSACPARRHRWINNRRIKQRRIVGSSLKSWQPLPSRQYAAKFEKVGHGSAQLRHEFKVYRELKGSTGICTVSVYVLTKICRSRS